MAPPVAGEQRVVGALDAELELSTIVVPQMSPAKQEAIEVLKQALADSIGALSIGNLVMNIVLGMGMKYLWKMVNLLQFVVFMTAWQI